MRHATMVFLPSIENGSFVPDREKKAQYEENPSNESCRKNTIAQEAILRKMSPSSHS